MDTGTGHGLNRTATQSGSRATVSIPAARSSSDAPIEPDTPRSDPTRSRASVATDEHDPVLDVTAVTDGDEMTIDLTAHESTVDRPDSTSAGDLATPSQRPPSPPLRRILVVADLLVLMVGWAACVLTQIAVLDAPTTWVEIVAEGGLIVAVGGFLMSATGLYRRRVCAIRSAEIARLGRVSALLTVATALLLVSRTAEWAMLAAGVGGVSWFALLTAERGFLREWIQGRRASGDFGAPVLIVGGDAGSTVRTGRFLAEHPVLGFEVRGIVSPPPGGHTLQPFAWLGPRNGLIDQLVRSRASGVVLDANSLTGDELNEVVQQLGSTNVHVHISSGLRGVDRRRITVSPLADETFLHVAPLGLTRRQFVAKRVVDMVLGVVALLVFSPLLILSACAIWAYDRGPVFFRQERVGHEGERFTLYKLRTMVVDAEARRSELDGRNARSGPLFKVARDPRITPVGRVLRATSIDELPQLLNVLEGTMSLVGPRPALPEEVASFDEQLNGRLSVKPGVTGLWQVEARDLSSFDLYRRYDLLYVQNWSIGLDLAVIARTVTVVGLRGLRALVPARFRGSIGDALE